MARPCRRSPQGRRCPGPAGRAVPCPGTPRSCRGTHGVATLRARSGRRSRRGRDACPDPQVDRVARCETNASSAWEARSGSSAISASRPTVRVMSGALSESMRADAMNRSHASVRRPSAMASSRLNDSMPEARLESPDPRAQASRAATSSATSSPRYVRSDARFHRTKVGARSSDSRSSSAAHDRVPSPNRRPRARWRHALTSTVRAYP